MTLEQFKATAVFSGTKVTYSQGLTILERAGGYYVSLSRSEYLGTLAEAEEFLYHWAIDAGVL